MEWKASSWLIWIVLFGVVVLAVAHLEIRSQQQRNQGAELSLRLGRMERVLARGQDGLERAVARIGSGLDDLDEVRRNVAEIETALQHIELEVEWLTLLGCYSAPLTEGIPPELAPNIETIKRLRHDLETDLERMLREAESGDKR